MKQVELMQEQARVMARMTEEMTAAAFTESERGAQQVMALWRENLDAMQESLRGMAAADFRDPQELVREMSRRQMEMGSRMQAGATAMFEQGLAFQSRLGAILRRSALDLGAKLPVQDAPAMGAAGRQMQDMMADMGTSFADAWKQSMDAIRVNFERFEMPAANLPAVAPKARRSNGSARARAA